MEITLPIDFAASRNGEDSHARELTSHASDEFNPFNIGHDDIGHQDICVARLEREKSGMAVSGAYDVKTNLLNNFHK